MLKEFAQRLCFKGNRADHQIRFEFEDLRNGFELPAISELWEVLYGSDVRAPARNANEHRSGAKRAKNGRCIRRERHNAELIPDQTAVRHSGSVGCPAKGRNESSERFPVAIYKSLMRNV